MSGATRSRHAARGYLARLVAVVAVLAGLVLAHGLQCNDGMTVMHAASGASMAADATHDCGAAAVTAAAVDVVSPESIPPVEASQRLADRCTASHTRAVVLAAGSSPGSHGLGGLLATCLAFIVAVVAALVGLRPTGLRGIVPMLRSARVAMMRAALPRAPSLAELCLLRT
ncbi:hypothetical protein ABZ215_42465 [Amycolatopsis sp. NPDC006131]|uniref:hypothetical protein n=1 Tax=Amycolatopsis sp. NPDC006131 TaxID=3156731 RepID=UPI0033A770BB